MKDHIRFDFGCKLVQGHASTFGHTFGGDIQYGGNVPRGCSVPVHLLFRLDLFDPVLPFKIVSGFRFLPFFYAFNYDASPMSYRVRSDNEIEILGIDTDIPNPGFPYPRFPKYFDLLPISVEPITYEEQRDITMSWFVHLHPEIYKAFPTEEIKRFKTLGYPPARIGRVHDLLQVPRGEPCLNPACQNHGQTDCLETLATIPEKPFKELDLWQADGPTIQIVYEICKLCDSIRTYTTCD